MDEYFLEPTKEEEKLIRQIERNFNKLKKAGYSFCNIDGGGGTGGTTFYKHKNGGGALEDQFPLFKRDIESKFVTEINRSSNTLHIKSTINTIAP